MEVSYLASIQKFARYITQFLQNDEAIFTELNRLSKGESQFFQWNDRYFHESGPVNDIRKAVLERLSNGEELNPEVLEELKSGLVDQYKADSYRAYNSAFRILYVLLLNYEAKEVKSRLEKYAIDIASRIKLDLSKEFSFSVSDFNGDRNFGTDRVWMALYNSSHPNQTTAIQLFLEINPDTVFIALYNRLENQFIERIDFNEEELQNVEGIQSTMVEFFRKHLQIVKNNKYENIEYRSIGAKGANVYKLSLGAEFFDRNQVQNLVDDKLVAIHKNTAAKGRLELTQFEEFENARHGDLFYLCWSNKRVLLLGQFVGDDFVDSEKDYTHFESKSWRYRAFKVIVPASIQKPYDGEQKWWTPNDNSTFIRINPKDIRTANKLLFNPLFKIDLDVGEPIDRDEEENKQEGINTDKNIVTQYDISPQLDIGILTDRFAGIIDNLDNQSAQMLGVFGQWGRGKTYFIKQTIRLLESNEYKKQYEVVRFHAWKYQDTKAVWAYLYESFSQVYYQRSHWHRKSVKDAKRPHQSPKSIPDNFFKKLLRQFWNKLMDWRSAFWLNIERNGWLELLFFFFTIFTTLVVAIYNYTKIQDQDFKLDSTWIPSIVLSVVSFLSYLKLENKFKVIGQKGKKIVEKYTQKVSFESQMGIQSEIQKELIQLLKTWVDETQVEKRKIVLFVDDLDRCNEERMIQVIDALRVMLEDEEIASRVIILSAIDEDILERGILWKYQKLYGDLTNEDNAGKSKDRRVELVYEYMDKLFIGGIKLPHLTGVEKEEMITAYAKGAEFIDPKATFKSDRDRLVEDEPPVFLGDEMQEQDDIIVDLGVNIENKAVSGFLLIEAEMNELRKQVAQLGDRTTPRQIRIYMYRYLLAKGIAGKYLRGGLLTEKYWKFLIVMICEKSVEKSDFKIDESLKAEDFDIDPKLWEFTPKLIDIVVPY